MSSRKAIPEGSLVLVTGLNGYIGSHIAEQLLRLGYRVRGTARDDVKLHTIMETLRLRNPNALLEGLVVKNMADESAFHKAAENCAGVIHVASDISMNNNPNAVVPQVVEGVKNALHAAGTTPSVKRFVYTSSSIAAVKPRQNVKFHVDEKSWNEEDLSLAWAPPPYEDSRSFSVYAASKIQAEKEAWAFMAKEQPGFVLNTVLPNFNVGEIMHRSQPASSAGWVKRLYEHDEAEPGSLKAFPPQYHINVVDCALVHVAALLEVDVQNERLFAFAGEYNYNDIVAVLKKIDPKWNGYPEPDPNTPRDLSTVANERARELLGRYGRSNFKTMEQSLKEQFAN